MGRVKAISISSRKGVRKDNIDRTELLPGHGLRNDAHGGDWHRQVSLLAQESIDTMRDKGLDVVAGNFAENITTEGIDLAGLQVGQHIQMGEAELIISQLGKICHTRCAIYHQAGDCVMPREGIFGVVVKGGTVRVGDRIDILAKCSSHVAIVAAPVALRDAGSALRQQALAIFEPAFVRLDTIGPKAGGSINAILEDLATSQQTPLIVIFDPEGDHLMALAGLPQEPTHPAIYKKGNSSLLYCRSVSDLQKFQSWFAQR